jgi:dipeptidase E
MNSNSRPERHLFPIGSNAFIYRADDGNDEHRLYRYILSKARNAKPKICLIPTASGDALRTIELFRKTFEKLGCEVTILSLFRGETEDLETLVMSQDVIYVSGGNTRNLMTLWKDWGLDTLVRRAYESGTVMLGGSAGSLCWFAEGVTDSIPGRLSGMKCMGILKGSNCPHYDGEANRRPMYHALIASEELSGGYANEDSVALHFINEQFVEAVSDQTGKHAYFVEMKDGQIIETSIPARKV